MQLRQRIARRRCRTRRRPTRRRSSNSRSGSSPSGSWRSVEKGGGSIEQIQIRPLCFLIGESRCSVHTAKKIRFMYSQKEDCAISFPMSMHSSFCERFTYIFPRSVHLYCCSKIGRPFVRIYKSLTDT